MRVIEVINLLSSSPDPASEVGLGFRVQGCLLFRVWGVFTLKGVAGCLWSRQVLVSLLTFVAAGFEILRAASGSLRICAPILPKHQG